MPVHLIVVSGLPGVGKTSVASIVTERRCGEIDAASGTAEEVANALLSRIGTR